MSMSSNVVSSSLTIRQSKLECFYTLYVFQDNITCLGKAGALIYLTVPANITLSNKLAQDNTLTYFTRSFQSLLRTNTLAYFARVFSSGALYGAILIRIIVLLANITLAKKLGRKKHSSLFYQSLSEWNTLGCHFNGKH